MNARNITFDPIEIVGSKVILRVLAEEGEPGNEAYERDHESYPTINIIRYYGIVTNDNYMT